MNPIVKTGLLSLVALAVAGMVVLGAMRIVERQETADEINRLRDQLYRARVTADRCRGSLQNSEASLRGLSVSIDSLKNVVDGHQTEAGGGVPAGQYQEYLAVFDEYNDSVAVWEGRERRLRTTETSCRETIQEHNMLSDSLQGVLVEAGIVPRQ